MSGQSGTGKSTIGRLTAAELAEEWNTEEVDATDLSAARVRELERGSYSRGLGVKSGRAFIVNESHGLNKAAVRQLLTTLERVPGHVVWVFTTTVEGQAAKVGLVSVKDSLDLSTAAGRLMANVLASVAAYENEVRGERVRAGQAVARANGKRWGGSKKGRRVKVTDLQATTIRKLRESGESVAAIAKTVRLSRPTIYSVLRAR